MRQRRTVLSLAAIAVASAGLAITIPAASADQTGDASAAATLSCDPKWNDEKEVLYVHCDYAGKYRGTGAFFQNHEYLWAGDAAKDHRAIIAHLSWYQNGSRHTTVRDAGAPNGTIKSLSIPEGTKVHLWVCLEGIGCGAKYASYA